MKTLILILLALTGCGLPTAKFCDTEGVVGTIGFEDPDGNCEIALKNVKVARHVLIEKGLLADKDQFAKEMGAVNIWVAAGDDLSDGNDGNYDGIANRIQLERHEKYLVHELLHRFQVNRLDTTSPKHAGWDTNGYDAMQAFYETKFTDPLAPPPPACIWVNDPYNWVGYCWPNPAFYHPENYWDY